MAIILTNNELELIAWSRQIWTTPGEYENEIFNIIIADIADGWSPVQIEDLGEVETETFETNIGPIECPRVYKNATIVIEEEEMHSQILQGDTNGY